MAGSVRTLHRPVYLCTDNARMMHGLDEICTDIARIRTDLHGCMDDAQTMHGHFMVPDLEQGKSMAITQAA